MRRYSQRWFIGPLLALAVLGGGYAVLSRAQGPAGQAPTGPSAAPRPESTELPQGRPGAASILREGTLLRVARNVAGDAKPVQVEADEIFTWSEEGKVALLLRGQVLVQQGVVHSRFQQGVVWVDVAEQKATGVLHVAVYGEGQVRVDTSAQVEDGLRIVLDLHTRGEFKVRTGHNKVVRQARADDPVVKRGRAEGLGPASLRPASPAVPGPPIPIPQQPAPPGPQNPPRGAGAPDPPAPTPAPAPSSGPPPLPPSFGTGPLVPPPVPPPAPTPAPAPAPVAPAPAARAPVRIVPPTEGVRPVSYEEQGTGTPAAQGGPPASAEVARPAPSPPAAAAPQGREAPGRLAQNDLGNGPPEYSPPTGPNNDPPPRRLLPDPRPFPSDRESAPDTRPTLPAPNQEPGQEDKKNPQLPPPSRPGAPPRPKPGGKPQQAQGGPRQYNVMPRTGSRFNIKIEPGPNNERAIIITGGVILTVRNAPGIGFLDLEADRLVIWTKGADPQQLVTNLQSSKGETSNDLEFYLAGNVEIRQQQRVGSNEQITVRAVECYYDVNRNVAIALDSSLELVSEKAKRTNPSFEPIIIRGDELLRTGPATYEIIRSEIFSSKLPSDPGLKVILARAVIQEKDRPLHNILGQQVYDPKTGEAVIQRDSIITGRNVWIELADFPIFYTPYLVANARDPLGPLQNFSFGYSHLFGVQTSFTLDIYKLLGLLPLPGTQWRMQLDYLGNRGPGLGTTFDYGGLLSDEPDPGFGPLPARYEGFVRLYGIYDRNWDNLGSERPNEGDFAPPGGRGRVYWRESFNDITVGNSTFQVQNQLSLSSDRNFIEQYFKREFDSAPNPQSNWLFGKWQEDNAAATALVQPRFEPWITQTEWLPRLDGYLLGQDILDLFTYNAHVNVAYAQLQTTNDQPSNVIFGPDGNPLPLPPNYPKFVSPTDVSTSTARFALDQELSMPFNLGPFRLVPYARVVLEDYTSDIAGNEVGRVWGGGGVRGSIPFTRLYPDLQNELLNINGINHKIVLNGNYFYANTNEPSYLLPQLDRLNDDATDQAIRDFRPREPQFNTQYGYRLATLIGGTSFPLYDPQSYAIRRLVTNRLDTLDHIDVFQADIFQRWQTKRGYPGSEHIVDWMLLDLSVSFFPEPNRDNFGQPISFLEYRYLWNIGDRTYLDSSGWYDPFYGGPHIFTVGVHYDRPDRTFFSLYYRQIDPLQSKAVSASISYTFSPKYAMTLTSTYDFGTAVSFSNSLLFTRIGTDIQVSLGVTWNTTQNNFGALVEIVPNLVPANKRFGPVSGGQGGQLINR